MVNIRARQHLCGTSHSHTLYLAVVMQSPSSCPQSFSPLTLNMHAFPAPESDHWMDIWALTRSFCKLNISLLNLSPLIWHFWFFYTEFDYVLEVYGFKPSLRTKDILQELFKYGLVYCTFVVKSGNSHNYVFT